MSLASWFAKRTTKEIVKGVFEAIREMLDELLTQLRRKDTASASKPRTHNTFPTAKEIEKQMDNMRKTKDDAHTVLMGRR